MSLSYLAGKTFSVSVCFSEICDTINCTFIAELFLAIWVISFFLFHCHQFVSQSNFKLLG